MQLCPDAHMFPQVPQLVASTLTSVHTPLQLCWGGGHWHCALRQVVPAGQISPQSPQFAGSTLGSTHKSPHRSWPVGQSPSELPSLTASAEHAPTASTDETRIQRNARTAREPTNFISNLQISLRFARSVELHLAQHASLRLLQNVELMVPDSYGTATEPGSFPRVDPVSVGGSLEPVPQAACHGARPLPCRPACGNDGSALPYKTGRAQLLPCSRRRRVPMIRGCGKPHGQGEEWQPGRNAGLLDNSSLMALPGAARAVRRHAPPLRSPCRPLPRIPERHVAPGPVSRHRWIRALRSPLCVADYAECTGRALCNFGATTPRSVRTAHGRSANVRSRRSVLTAQQSQQRWAPSMPRRALRPSDQLWTSDRDESVADSAYGW